MLPNREIVRILERAYPCHSFQGACNSVRWNPQKGFVPRGFIGATDTIGAVEVVFVLSEPGNPLVGLPDLPGGKPHRLRF